MGECMIRVKNLIKIFKSKKKDKCIALDNVSFTLEDKGFVFIIGKSGSGKTTLLSIIGGLDNLTKGEISINGNLFSKFKEKDYVNYRNTMIGYIFQDFHLIDELTIYENIKISLDLQNNKDVSLIGEMLEKVGLKGYENRYPNELSGGEKQRIAIARALIKNPRIILADEPTGNLDTKTTSQVLSLLKELSKERLVIIVSHNLNDAREYADQIIELSSGKIINDLMRNDKYSDEVKLIDDELFIPVHKKFLDKESDFINSKLIEGKIKRITQVDDIFIKNNKKEKEEIIDDPLTNKKFSLKNMLNLSFKFLKKDAVRLVLYSFVVACLIVILGLSQLIVSFDSSSIIEKELKNINQNSVSIFKEDIVNADIEIDKNCVLPIDEEDINKYYNAGYKGNIYELVNVPLDYGTSFLLSEYHKPNKVSYKDIYHSGTRGTLITTEDYLIDTFGSLEYVALCDEIKDEGIYITDYSADAILFYKNGSFIDYNSILGKHKSMGVNYYAYINGIIKTDYKEKYNSIFDTLMNVDITKEELMSLINSEEYRAYYDDVVQNLSISYTMNKNFKEDFVASNSRSWVPVENSLFIKDNKEYEIERYFENGAVRSNYILNDDEIVMSYEKYNTFFNTNYNEGNMNEFTPVDVEFKYYRNHDVNKEEVIYSTNLKITKLIKGNVVYVNDKVFKEILSHNTFTLGLYFDDISNVSLISDVAFENGFSFNSIIAEVLTTITKAVNVFSGFFNIIFIGLCVAAFLILANYGMKLVKDRKYEIGVLKALGIKDKDLISIFGVQIIIAILLIIMMYIIGSILFIDLSNDVLIKSLMELAPNNLVLDIDILFINLNDLVSYSILIILIVFISFALPIAILRRLKPLDIVKAKE